jgi:hypothetical protein
MTTPSTKLVQGLQGQRTNAAISLGRPSRPIGSSRMISFDAVIRYNQEGIEGLRDRPKPGRLPTFTF